GGLRLQPVLQKFDGIDDPRAEFAGVKAGRLPGRLLQQGNKPILHCLAGLQRLPDRSDAEMPDPERGNPWPPRTPVGLPPFCGARFARGTNSPGAVMSTASLWQLPIHGRSLML